MVDCDVHPFLGWPVWPHGMPDLIQIFRISTSFVASDHSIYCFKGKDKFVSKTSVGPVVHTQKCLPCRRVTQQLTNEHEGAANRAPTATGLSQAEFCCIRCCLSCWYQNIHFALLWLRKGARYFFHKDNCFLGIWGFSPSPTSEVPMLLEADKTEAHLFIKNFNLSLMIILIPSVW